MKENKSSLRRKWEIGIGECSILKLLEEFSTNYLQNFQKTRNIKLHNLLVLQTSSEIFHQVRKVCFPMQICTTLLYLMQSSLIKGIPTRQGQLRNWYEGILCICIRIRIYRRYSSLIISMTLKFKTIRSEQIA